MCIWHRVLVSRCKITPTDSTPRWGREADGGQQGVGERERERMNMNSWVNGYSDSEWPICFMLGGLNS